MQCPSCHKEVKLAEKDIGALFTCPSCRNVYFINFDGTPDFGEVQQVSEDELKALQQSSLPQKKKSKPKDHQDEQQPSNFLPLEQQQVAPDVPFLDASSLQIPMGNQQENVVDEANIQITEEQNFFAQRLPDHLNQNTLSQAESLPIESPFSDTDIFSQNLQSVEQTASESTDGGFQAMAQEIENFGNDQTVVSGLTYDLEIINVDSKEAMELLREALDDSKFGWNVEDFIKEIKAGKMTIKNLSPVHAYVLARRIQFIDLTMKWTQNVVV